MLPVGRLPYSHAFFRWRLDIRGKRPRGGGHRLRANGLDRSPHPARQHGRRRRCASHGCRPSGPSCRLRRCSQTRGRAFTLAQAAIRLRMRLVSRMRAAGQSVVGRRCHTPGQRALDWQSGRHHGRRRGRRRNRRCAPRRPAQLRRRMDRLRCRPACLEKPWRSRGLAPLCRRLVRCLRKPARF